MTGWQTRKVSGSVRLFIFALAFTFLAEPATSDANGRSSSVGTDRARVLAMASGAGDQRAEHPATLYLKLTQGNGASSEGGEGLFGPLTWPEQLDLETYRGNSFGAYEAALKDGKYTMILFETEYCGFCKRLAENLADERFVKYSDRVVVSISDGDEDEGARQLEEALGVVRYPTLVILRTNNENIHVTGRIEGEVTPEQIERVVKEVTEDPIVAN